MGHYYYYTSDKNAVLAYSHYSDPSYKGDGAIIFGREIAGMQWEYADRLRQWDYEKSEAAWEQAVKTHGERRTAARIEGYLQNYFEDDGLELLCVRTGTQAFNGYPWYAYGFKPSQAAEAQEA